MPDNPTHEVWLELTSGTRVIVGSALPDVAAANAVATTWKKLAETQPDVLHETTRGSGVVVRGSSIIAIKAQHEPSPTALGGLVKTVREGTWL
jgi:hypothetical protein